LALRSIRERIVLQRYKQTRYLGVPDSMGMPGIR